MVYRFTFYFSFCRVGLLSQNVHVVQDPTYKLGDYDWCQSHENENRAFPSENGKGLRFTDISLP